MKSGKSKRKIVLYFVVFTALVAFSYKTYQYAAPPVEPKNCTFAYPRVVIQPTTATASVASSALALAQEGGSINDASCLNQTPVYGVVEVRIEEDVRAALQFARESGLKVTPAGRRHSMGGQSFSPGGLVLDMRSFNQISIDREQRILRAQSGATWAQIENALDKQGLSLRAVQSINIFTVGGTLSVNAHGIAHDPGQIAPTVRSLRIMTSDGTIHRASPTENTELFRHALGGYGLFGVILDVEIALGENEVYDWQIQHMDYRDFPKYFAENVAGRPEVGLFFGRLSLSPSSYLTEASVHRYQKSPLGETLPALEPQEHIWLMRLILNFSKTGGVGRWLRWSLEKNAAPRLRPCVATTRLGVTECVITRNQAQYDSMEYLTNRLPDTDILQEYFVPREKLASFVDGLRDTVTRHRANLVNVTIRIVNMDEVTALPYAKQDMFAFVLYFNQGLNEEDSKVLEKTTSDLIDLAANFDGTFYLPYQLYYSPQQLRRAYPEVDSFFATKRKYDPGELFSNKFYEKYGRTQP